MDESNICDRCTCTYGDGDGALCPTCGRYLCYLCFGGMPTESPPDWKPEKKCIRCEHDQEPRIWNRRIRQVCARCGGSFWPGVKVVGRGEATRHAKCPAGAKK